MRVLVLENGDFKERNIENTLEELQSIVGGYIEIPFLGNRFANEVIDVIINEEGKFMSLEPQIAVLERGTNRILDLVVGTCIFASHDDEGETVGLTDKQIKVIKDELQREAVMSDMKTVLKVLFM